MQCDCCGEIINGQAVELVKEANIEREGIEMDVEVLKFFCSDECKTEYLCEC
jgi:hypothetical protein